MYCSSSMHPNANKENTSTSNVQQNFVRITRSRAKKALGGGSSIPPTKPSFKQVLKHVLLIKSHKRIAADYDAQISNLPAFGLSAKETCST